MPISTRKTTANQHGSSLLITSAGINATREVGQGQLGLRGYLHARAGLIGLIAGFAASILAPAFACAQALTDDVQRLVTKGRFGQATVGVSIIDTRTGDVLASHRSGTSLIPASNQKLLTSGAALQVLRPEFNFTTELVIKDGVLVIRGSGDPALGDPEVLKRSEPPLTVEAVLDALAKAASNGLGVGNVDVKRVQELVIDDRVFDREFIHPDWPERNFSQPHSAQIAGVNFRANTLAVFPRPNPDGVGTAPMIAMEPLAPWIRIENRARTVGQGQNTIGFSRAIGTNNFVLTGSVRFPSKAPIEATIDTPPMFFGQVLVAHLSRAGVEIGGRAAGAGDVPAGVRLATDDDNFEGGTVLAVINTPIGEILQRCNADSENIYAEALLKRMGHEISKAPGSWANGSAVVRMVLSEKLGAEQAASTVVADGSGISRNNAVSPSTITRFLDVMASDSKLRGPYIKSMATPGNGTLRSRFGNANLKNELHAKSGFINGVRTLSGYVIDPERDRTIAFSVMINNITTGDQTTAAMALHEDVVKLIDLYLEGRKKTDQPKLGG